jgi:hypothetical protein
MHNKIMKLEYPNMMYHFNLKCYSIVIIGAPSELTIELSKYYIENIHV